MYDPIKKRFEKQKNRTFDWFDNDLENIDLPPTFFSAADEMGFKIVGCDLTNAELDLCAQQLAAQFPDQYYFDEEFELLEKRGDPDYMFTNMSDEAMLFRDIQIAETILKYRLQSARTIIAVMGAAHGWNIHNAKLLQDNGFGYAYIDQRRKRTT